MASKYTDEIKAMAKDYRQHAERFQDLAKRIEAVLAGLGCDDLQCVKADSIKLLRHTDYIIRSCEPGINGSAELTRYERDEWQWYTKAFLDALRADGFDTWIEVLVKKWRA